MGCCSKTPFMKLIKCLLPGLIACKALLHLEAGAATWSTDLPAAQAKAKAENKMVLINFTALDRAKWCIRLNEEVFSQPEFDKFASNNLVLVEVDFSTNQNAALLRANETLAQQFHVQGYPTLIVLNSQGKKTASLGYVEGGPASFIAALSPNPGGRSLHRPSPKLQQNNHRYQSRRRVRKGPPPPHRWHSPR